MDGYSMIRIRCLLNWNIRCIAFLCNLVCIPILSLVSSSFRIISTSFLLCFMLIRSSSLSLSLLSRIILTLEISWIFIDECVMLLILYMAFINSSSLQSIMEYPYFNWRKKFCFILWITSWTNSYVVVRLVWCFLQYQWFFSRINFV